LARRLVAMAEAHWFELEERAVRSLLYTFTEHAFYLKEDKPAPWAPTRRKIGDLLEALTVICIQPTDLDQPAWLDGRTSGIIVAIGNGLLDLEQRCLIPHTPLFFNQTSVPFDYQPDAPEPRHWLTFLEALWPTEPETINVLSEWFGYVVSGRTDLHKILMMVGPTRGGKGDCPHSHGSRWPGERCGADIKQP
jgi:putative DNA primase/helicase